MSDGEFFAFLPFRLYDVVRVQDVCPVCAGMIGVVFGFIGKDIVTDRNWRGNIEVRFLLPDGKYITEYFDVSEFSHFYLRSEIKQLPTRFEVIP